MPLNLAEAYLVYCNENKLNHRTETTPLNWKIYDLMLRWQHQRSISIFTDTLNRVYTWVKTRSGEPVPTNLPLVVLSCFLLMICDVVNFKDMVTNQSV